MEEMHETISQNLCYPDLKLTTTQTIFCWTATVAIFVAMSFAAADNGCVLLLVLLIVTFCFWSCHSWCLHCHFCCHCNSCLFLLLSAVLFADNCCIFLYATKLLLSTGIVATLVDYCWTILPLVLQIIEFCCTPTDLSPFGDWWLFLLLQLLLLIVHSLTL